MSKTAQLREGEIVDWISPSGEKTRAFFDRESQSLKLGTGEELPLPETLKKDLLAETPQDVRVSEEREKLRQAQSGYGENLGDFLYSLTDTGVLGGLKDYAQYGVSALQSIPQGEEGKGYLERLGDRYAAKKQAQKDITEETSKRSPFLTQAGAGLEYAGEIFNPYTKGVQAAKLLPALSVVSRGTEAFRKPGETAVEAGISSVLGALGDKVAQGLGKVAGRRGLRRQVAADAERIGAANKEGEAAYRQAVQQTKFANEMEKAAAREANIRRGERLRDFQVRQAERETELGRIAKEEEKAQRLFSEGVKKNADRIGNTLGKNRSVDPEQLAVKSFTAQEVSQGASKEAKQAANFINNTFDKELNGPQLSSALKKLEDKISSSNAPAREILLNFKEHLASTVPEAITETRVYRSLFPSLERDVMKAIDQVFKRGNFSGGLITEEMLKKELRSSLGQLSKTEFLQAVKEGNVNRFINEGFEKVLEKAYGGAERRLGRQKNVPLEQIMTPADRRLLAQAPKRVEQQVQKKLTDYGIDISIAPETTRRQLGRAAENIRGAPAQLPRPEPIPPPQLGAPAQPRIKPPPPPFSPQPIPEVPQAQGVAERMGDFLENANLGTMLKGRGGIDNPVTRLAALKYIFGKAALPIEAGAAAGMAGLKAATSPTSLGEAIRFGINRSPRVISTQIDSYFSQKYPSYEAGVIQNPQERLEAVTEIENSPYLKFEDKAYYQMKVNRGKPIR